MYGIKCRKDKKKLYLCDIKLIKTAMPNIVSLFSGCGGLDLGFEQRGYNTIWANDFRH